MVSTKEQLLLPQFAESLTMFSYEKHGTGFIKCGKCLGSASDIEPRRIVLSRKHSRIPLKVTFDVGGRFY